MLEFSELLEKELMPLADTLYIRSIHFAPINKNGRAVSCFTPFHIGYPDKSVQDGNHLETLCWYANDYAISMRYRKHSKNLQAIDDCTSCSFCLKKASGYYLALSIEAPGVNTESVNSMLLPVIANINKQLNRPLKTVSVTNDATEESWQVPLEVK